MTVQSWGQAKLELDTLSSKGKQRWMPESPRRQSCELALTSLVTLWHSLEERGEEKHVTSDLLPGFPTS